MCPLVRPLQPSQMEGWWFSCCHLQPSPWRLGLSKGSSGLAVRTRPGFRGSGPPSCQGDPHWESSDDLPPFGAKMMVVKKQWILTNVYALNLRGRKKLGGTVFKGETSRGCWAIFPTDNSMKTDFAFFKQKRISSHVLDQRAVSMFSGKTGSLTLRIAPSVLREERDLGQAAQLKLPGDEGVTCLGLSLWSALSLELQMENVQRKSQALKKKNYLSSAM